MNFEQTELNAQETQEITKYEKSFGADWVARALRHKRASKYLDGVCELVKDKCRYATPYRCYREGDDVYRRKDGLPIQDNDLAALRVIDKGQGNTVRLSQDGMEMTHSWVCDSSD